MNDDKQERKLRVLFECREISNENILLSTWHDSELIPLPYEIDRRIPHGDDPYSGVPFVIGGEELGESGLRLFVRMTRAHPDGSLRDKTDITTEVELPRKVPGTVIGGEIIL